MSNEDSIEAEFQRRLNGCDPHSDMIPFLGVLRDLAADYVERRGYCRVVEFGHRTGNSTVAFLAGGAHVVSYDIRPPDRSLPLGPVRFVLADTASLESVPEWDILLIDTLHNYEQVRRELRHARADRLPQSGGERIVLHDTELFGGRDEMGNGPGINRAIEEFLADNKEWREERRLREGCGLTILERCKRQ